MRPSRSAKKTLLHTNAGDETGNAQDALPSLPKLLPGPTDNLYTAPQPSAEALCGVPHPRYREVKRSQAADSPIQSFMTTWSLRRTTPAMSSNPHFS